MASSRYDNGRQILGEKLFARVQDAKVLVVGAGGIGCELIKNLVLTGFGTGEAGRIDVLDLDTIDLSNLNRQFLFQKQHVKRSKALVARETALTFNPEARITALHRNIKDAEFNVPYFRQFDVVMNALDNLDARRHVNRMALAARVPLIESGTQGYVGQVQPIRGDVSECFDCVTKPVPKSFAVCTIRSTPSTPHHCIVWAKNYLFPLLFGAAADDEAELDAAAGAGENRAEIEELKKESRAVQALRAGIGAPDAPARIFDKVYHADIARLLQMEDMWRHRRPPVPLAYAEFARGAGHDVPGTSGGDIAEASPAAGTSAPDAASVTAAPTIKDQRALSPADSFRLFVSSIERLAARLSAESDIAFDKDDDDTLDFVVAAANLRAHAFHIPSQTRFEVKEYAGNIIPAIATTNAIIAGVIVLQSLNILRDSFDSARMVWLARSSTKVFSLSPLPAPNPQCAVCRVVYVPIKIRPDLTLGEFVEKVVAHHLPDFEHIILQEGTRMLYETEDFEDNNSKTLMELGLGDGSNFTVLHDDEPHFPICFSISGLISPNESEQFIIDGDIPETVPLRELPKTQEEEDSDDEAVEFITEETEQHKKRTASDAGLAPDSFDKKTRSEVLVID